MAFLGAQLVITLIMVSVIQKVGPHYSLARWFLCSTGLTRYLYPTNHELKTLANVPKDKSKNKIKNKNYQNGKNGDAKQPETFHVPRNLDIQLESWKVSPLDVIHLRYYTEYQWLIDFSLYSIIVYTLTEMYTSWFPINDEVNLSMLWCILVLGFSVKMLISLTIEYFKGAESEGERSTCIVMGFTYLLMSMMILIVDENTLEFGLNKAYSSFNESAAAFLSTQGLNSSGPASKLVLKFFLALWCALLGSLFTFPGLRVAKMHWDLLKYFKDSKITQLLLNLNFALPFILVILWIKPVSRDYLTIRIFSGMTEPIMSDASFETLRLVAIIATVLLRFILMPWYLQAYLDMAYHRIEEQKKEAGRITNIELQKKVASVFCYLCVVVIQYVAPLLICLYFTFMFKTLGGYSWSSFLSNTSDMECSATEVPPLEVTAEASVEGEVIKQSAQEFHLALESLKAVFTEDVFRGLLGFATWWTCFTWFATTSVGMIYQSYFSHS